MRRAALVAMVLLVGMSGCGLFSPRDSTPPTPPSEQRRTDPLNFRALLAGTGYSFSNLDYMVLFTEGMTYQQVNNLPASGSELIARLSQIENQYRAVAVRWRRSYTPAELKTDQDNDIFAVHYDVFLDSSLAGALPDFSGISDFKIRYNNGWTISYRSDNPDSLLAGRSFFSPIR